MINQELDLEPISDVAAMEAAADELETDIFAPEGEGSATEIAEVQPAQVMQPLPSDSPIMGLVAQAVASNNLDMVDRLLVIRDNEEARAAEAAFNIAFSNAQAEMPIIEKRGTGHNSIRYARLEDMMQGAKPVLARHGLSIRHNSSNESGPIVTTAILAHVRGHSERCTCLLYTSPSPRD